MMNSGKNLVYKVKLTKIACEAVRKMDAKMQAAIIKKIEAIALDPLLHGKQLRGPLKNLRLARTTGQRHRIIYRVIEEEVLVIVIAIGLRKEGDKKDIYELMKKYIRTGPLKNTSRE